MKKDHPIVDKETESCITLKMHHKVHGQPKLMKTKDGLYSLPGYRKAFNDRLLAITVFARACRNAGWQTVIHG